jgi:adenylate cyclase
VIAEIELSAEKELFNRPDWLGEEVTSKKNYYNAFIASHPYKEWEKSTDKKSCTFAVNEKQYLSC